MEIIFSKKSIRIIINSIILVQAIRTSICIITNNNDQMI